MLLTGPILAKPEFDPDAYLRSKATPVFDPDAYLHEKQISDMAKGVGGGESFLRGGAQGATLGFGDELQGVVQAGLGRAIPEFMGGFGPDHKASFAQDFTQNRDAARLDNAAAQRAHGALYATGEATGSVLPTALVGGATGTLTAPAVARQGIAKYAPLLAATGQGAAQGAGYSDANTPGGLAADSALGAAVGLAGYGAGKALDAGVGRVSRLLAGRISNAAGRAAAQGTEDATAPVSQAISKYGGTRQNASRATEVLLRSEDSGLLNPQAQAAVQAAKASPDFAETISGVAKNYADDLPTLMPAMTSAKAEMQALQQGLPQAIQSRTAELLKPSFGADARSFAKSYAEPLVWGLLAQQGANAFGLDPKTQAVAGVIAGSIGGRTRAGKALMMRLNRPGNQIAIAEAGQKVAATTAEILKRAVQGAAPIATQELVAQ